MPAEYVGSLVAAIAEYPIWVAEMLSHPTHGLAGKCKYQPVPADVVEMAEKLLEREATINAQRQKHAQRSELQAVPLGAYRGCGLKYNPFPKLTEAFASEPELLANQPWNTLFMASRSLATQGEEAARQVLATVQDRVGKSYGFAPLQTPLSKCAC